MRKARRWRGNDARSGSWQLTSCHREEDKRRQPWSVRVRDGAERAKGGRALHDPRRVAGERALELADGGGGELAEGEREELEDGHGDVEGLAQSADCHHRRKRVAAKVAERLVPARLAHHRLGREADFGGDHAQDGVLAVAAVPQLLRLAHCRGVLACARRGGQLERFGRTCVDPWR